MCDCEIKHVVSFFPIANNLTGPFFHHGSQGAPCCGRYFTFF